MARPKKKRCDTPYCRNTVQGKRAHCGKCRSKLYRERNPERYAYQTLKSHAKANDVHFGLTFEEFIEFAQKHNYIKGRGRSVDGLHVDRVIVGRYPGYVKDNIQVLPNHENVVKMWTVDYNYHNGRATTRKFDDVVVGSKEDLPF